MGTFLIEPTFRNVHDRPARGSASVLGAVTLEEFALSVDPVARRLVPVSGYLMAYSLMT